MSLSVFVFDVFSTNCLEESCVLMDEYGDVMGKTAGSALLDDHIPVPKRPSRWSSRRHTL